MASSGSSFVSGADGSFFLRQPTLPPAGQLNTSGGSFFLHQPTLPPAGMGGRLPPVVHLDSPTSQLVPMSNTMPTDMATASDLDVHDELSFSQVAVMMEVDIPAGPVTTAAAAVDVLGVWSVETELQHEIVQTDALGRLWDTATVYAYSEYEDDYMTREVALANMHVDADPFGIQVELLQEPRLYRRIDDGYSVETEYIMGFIDGEPIRRVNVYRLVSYP